jgi:hypothetical protein
MLSSGLLAECLLPLVTCGCLSSAQKGLLPADGWHSTKTSSHPSVTSGAAC